MGKQLQYLGWYVPEKTIEYKKYEKKRVCTAHPRSPRRVRVGHRGGVRAAETSFGDAAAVMAARCALPHWSTGPSRKKVAQGRRSAEFRQSAPEIFERTLK